MNYNLAVVAFVAITGSFTFGFANSCIGSIQGLNSFLEYFNLAEPGQYSNIIRGALSGVFAGGSGIGALALSSIADRWGRVRTLQLTSMLCIIGGAIQTGSTNATMLLIGRLISGFGVGMIVALVPIYQSEISPPESRGFLVSSHGVFIVTGYVSNFLEEMMNLADIQQIVSFSLDWICSILQLQSAVSMAIHSCRPDDIAISSLVRLPQDS